MDKPKRYKYTVIDLDENGQQTGTTKYETLAYSLADATLLARKTLHWHPKFGASSVITNLTLKGDS